MGKSKGKNTGALMPDSPHTLLCRTYEFIGEMCVVPPHSDDIDCLIEVAVSIVNEARSIGVAGSGWDGAIRSVESRIGDLMLNRRLDNETLGNMRIAMIAIATYIRKHQTG